MSQIIPDNFGSTYLNPSISTYGDLVYRTKSLLGFPVQNDEMTDSQWAQIIDEAIEIFTQWGGGSKEEYLIFCANQYQRGCGVKLDDLVQVGCNTQYCTQTVVTTPVTSTVIDYNLLATNTGFLSATPFVYPVNFNRNDPTSVAFTATSGQDIHLYYDPKKPWNAFNVCNANCITINPVSSQWFQLSSNSNLSSLYFDFINDTSISFLTSSLSANILNYPLSAVPISGMGNSLSSVPISFYDLSAFYPPNEFVGPPLEACIEIGQGIGYIFPKCDLNAINACSALSAQYSISPAYEYVLTGNTISGIDGKIWDLSATDISNATHVLLNNIPICAGDGILPLTSNNGIVASFTICNSALSTNGKMFMESVQFLKDYKPPAEILYDTNCNWINNGFTMNSHISAYTDCVLSTPAKVKVDVSFYDKQTTTEVGEISTYYSSAYDYGLQRRRKVTGVFALDNANNTGSYGGYGSDLLFNFDYALLASTFGYNLQGSRINAGLGYDLVSYHLARSFVEMSKNMLRRVSYTWDARTQFLKMQPEPPLQYQSDPYSTGQSCSACCDTPIIGGVNNQCYLIGVYVEAPVQELLAEDWIREYVLARAKQTLGIMRDKYGNIKLYDGTTITGNALWTEGAKRIEELRKELRNDNYYTSPAMFFVG